MYPGKICRTRSRGMIYPGTLFFNPHFLRIWWWSSLTPTTQCLPIRESEGWHVKTREASQHLFVFCTCCSTALATHLQESAVYPLLHSRAHRYLRSARITVIQVANLMTSSRSSKDPWPSHVHNVSLDALMHTKIHQWCNNNQIFWAKLIYIIKCAERCIPMRSRLSVASSPREHSWACFLGGWDGTRVSRINHSSTRPSWTPVSSCMWKEMDSTFRLGDGFRCLEAACIWSMMTAPSSCLKGDRFIPLQKITTHLKLYIRFRHNNYKLRRSLGFIFSSNSCSCITANKTRSRFHRNITDVSLSDVHHNNDLIVL